MKITITGSLGHISKPLAQELVQKGHSVTVISSQTERKKDIEALGAKAAIGTIEDSRFLASAFADADAVYCMLPPPRAFSNPNLSDPNFDFLQHAKNQGSNYVQAIRKSRVRRVIHLSSVGAHMDKGNGLIGLHTHVERIFRELPSEVAITHMRPVGFYYNMLAFIHGIKTQGMIVSNYGAGDTVPWVSPIDIAAAVAEEMENPRAGRTIRYVASDELTCNEVASILGAPIGKPGLRWLVIPDEQLQSGLIAAGMNPSVAAGYVELNASMHSGKLFEDYNRNKPGLGKVKVKDFANEFAAAFNRA